MKRFRLSVRAQADLVEIARFTKARWGSEQAAKYVNSVEECCELLANNPEMGRKFDAIEPGLRRMEHGSHVVLYRMEGTSIFVLRILHKSMLPRL